MKQLWWTWILVFFLGAMAGTGIGISLPLSPDPTPEPPPPETAVPTQAPEAILPRPLQYTNLVIRNLLPYDGPSLEDGTDTHLENTAALIVENTGNVGIQYLSIRVEQGGRQLDFDATYLPPRSTVMILESGKAPYVDTPMDSARCRTLIPGSFDMCQGDISIREAGGGSLLVTNRTDTAIPRVTVYYKSRSPGDSLYLGGLTYSVQLQDLAPGETRTVTPWRFASGYCGIVAVICG